MKTILKKNQVMITSLAMMIAIAGYLNFTGSQVEHENLVPTSGTSITNETMELNTDGLIEIPSLDIDLSQGDLVMESPDLDYLMDSMEVVANNPIENGEIPGEAVFTTSTNVSTLSGAKLLKEQSRAKNKEFLLEIINNTTIDAIQKQGAVDSLVALTEIAEMESAAEILLETKGFTDSIVSISENSVDVIINLTEISEAQRAQIEDIVTRKSGVEPQNIVISPMEY